MFTCGLCKQQSEPSERAVTVVTERREKVYRSRQNAHPYRKTNTVLYADDPGGVGTEIAKEVRAHAKCAAEYAAGQVQLSEGVLRRRLA